MVHSFLGQRLIRHKWEVSLPDVGLSKSLRTKAQHHFQKAQYLIEGRDAIPPTMMFIKMYLFVFLRKNWDVLLYDQNVFLFYSNMMIWHVFIGGCKSQGLHQILIEFNIKELSYIQWQLWACKSKLFYFILIQDRILLQLNLCACMCATSSWRLAMWCFYKQYLLWLLTFNFSYISNRINYYDS